MPIVYVRTVKRGQVILAFEHGLTADLTCSSLRASAGSACTLESAIPKDVVPLSARHPHNRVVIDSQFLSLVDVADSMGDEFLNLRYVVNLQVRDTGVVDTTGQWKDS